MKKILLVLIVLCHLNIQASFGSLTRSTHSADTLEQPWRGENLVPHSPEYRGQKAKKHSQNETASQRLRRENRELIPFFLLQEEDKNISQESRHVVSKPQYSFFFERFFTCSRNKKIHPGQ